MSERTQGPRRRLDLSSANVSNANPPSKAKVSNPYAKNASKSASTSSTGFHGGLKPTGATTPVESFFLKKKSIDGASSSSSAKRQLLVTPQRSVGVTGVAESKIGEKRKHVDDVDYVDENYDESFYYHSGEELNETSKNNSAHKPERTYSNIDYRHRGELPLDEPTMKAYRFVRNHFLIPRDIESDPKFGPHSGTCFEERVIRAYSLGMLTLKKSSDRGDGASLLVCTYCGEEGHNRDECLELLWSKLLNLQVDSSSLEGICIKYLFVAAALSTPRKRNMTP